MACFYGLGKDNCNGGGNHLDFWFGVTYIRGFTMYKFIYVSVSVSFKRLSFLRLCYLPFSVGLSFADLHELWL